MADSKKIPALTVLSQQLHRHDEDIIAYRNNKPLNVLALRRRVKQIYHVLNTSNIDNWALAVQDSFDFVSSLFALFYCGKQIKLLNPRYREMHGYFQAVLTDDASINSETFSNHQIVNINCLGDYPNHDFAEKKFKSQSLTIFTSGSTGLPKPIIKTLEQLEKESRLIVDRFDSFADCLFVASVCHDHFYGLTFKIMLSLANRAPFICERIHYQEQLDRYRDRKIVFITTPSMINTFDSQLKSDNCKYIFSSGGPLTYQTANLSLQCLGILPNEIYGSSETGIIATRVQHLQNEPWQLMPNIRLVESSEKIMLESPLLEHAEPLNDQITMIDSKRFHLHGRLDKIVKIAEMRVSLTYIENQLVQLPEIISAVAIPLKQGSRTIIGAIIQLSNQGIKKSQSGKFHLTRSLRVKLKDKMSTVMIPKKWRFVDKPPTNQQGKTTYLALKSLFDKQESTMNKTLPKEIDINIDHENLQIMMSIPQELFWFRGHFHSNPVLPGVVQLNWVMHYTKKLLNIQSDIQSIDVIKFQTPILPNDNLLLKIKWEPLTQKIQFSYTLADKVVSSGKLTLC